MKQSDLISTIAERTGFHKSQVKMTIDTFTEVCRSELLAEGEVRLVDLGKFSTSLRKASVGRNPRTGEKLNIPATRKVKFLAAKALKDELNPKPVARRRRA